ncbi:MAG: transcriptional repressor [Caulobacteraceae bacterium]|nr:Fur family transcriptional regulator [Caulobacter sp.]RYF94524.1 MAG: transcriptional repressor [Caulobacteraceae bacterium]
MSCGHDHHSTGLSGGALSAELTAADARCVDAGQKLTAPRRRVLELLLEAGQPVKAYDLIATFADGAPAKPPTVYRALEFLSKQGFAHRIESLNAYVACRHSSSEGADNHAAAFLICDCCGATREIDPAVLDSIQAAAGARDFTVQNVTIEAHGLCADCSA